MDANACTEDGAGPVGIDGPAMDVIRGYFDSRGWEPAGFQERAWRAQLAGRDGLIHAPTGVGKTLAAWMGPVGAWAARDDRRGWEDVNTSSARNRRTRAAGLEVLWLTPLRALASDTAASLEEPVRALDLPWRVERRTGDTSWAQKKAQRARLPTALVTTPESLSVMLSYPEHRELLGGVRWVVVDEWHELLSTKRGVQAELALARVRTVSPGVRIWGLSATLANLEGALGALVGVGRARAGVLVRGEERKRVEVETVIPGEMERFPWAGHLGLRALGQVVEMLEEGGTTLLFTNTRSQAEIWFKALIQSRPDWIGEVAIHHGSLERAIRDQVEAMLKEGRVRCVVCTSSLDLGVDFSPVDRVLQVGSPKGVARLVQRAGRSGHRPGVASVVTGVPAHALELVEFSAARCAIEGGRVEERSGVRKPLDVLVQHLVTCGCGGGFGAEALREEVRGTRAFAGLTDREWGWAMDFASGGGPALRAYPEYGRIREGEDGLWRVSGGAVERLHRMSIGTISADQAVLVKYRSGRTLGAIEESFVARLVPGDRFVFAGQVLELERLREMTAYVRRARSRRGVVPRWSGGKMPLSSRLAAEVRDRLERARDGEYDDREMMAVRGIMELQRAWSVIPTSDELLVERTVTTRGSARAWHHFVFPLEGRAVHEGLAPLVAHRLAQRRGVRVVASVTDYGFEIRCEDELVIDEGEWRELFSGEGLVEDLLACLNTGELSRRRFRDIARVAGLVVHGMPGSRKTGRHLQASSEMFFDVLSEFDPGNLLLDQARREVLEDQFEVVRLRGVLERIAGQDLRIVDAEHLTPMSFPLWAETLRATTHSGESWNEAVAKMVVRLERKAGRVG